MPIANPIASPPIGGILDRYLIRGFVRALALSLLCFTGLYLIVDFFDQIDDLLRAGAPVWTSFKYFLYKLPQMVSRVFPFGALFAALFSLGTLARAQEITAMRSGGLSLRRISLPVLLFSLLVGFFSFFWSESLVPIFTSKAQHIYRTQVRKKQPHSLLGTKDIWLRGEGAFISVERFDTKKNVLAGVSIYLLNPDFSLKGLIEAPSARWNGKSWEARGSMEWLFLPDGKMRQRKMNTALPLTETPDDLKVLARKPEEFSLFDLQKQIADLQAKGISATEYEVDVQVKMALPLVPPLLVLLAIPFALKGAQAGGIALSFGFTLLIGIAFWFLLAFAVSLGHSGALPPWVAAWLPNVTLASIALFYSTAEE